MRRVLVTLAFLGAAACGDISNQELDDLSFVQALPRAADLRLSAPEAEAQALTAEGFATSASALKICTRPLQQEPFCDGLRMAHSINTFTAVVLGTLDFVRTLPPNERGDDRRVWGPFPDDKRPDRATRVVVTRGPGERGYEYNWTVQVRAVRSQDPWIELLAGSFVPNRRGAASRGVGFFTWEPAEARAAGLEAAADADRLEIRYDLRRAAHIEADAAFAATAEMPETLRFVQDHAEGGAGSWAYAFPWATETTGGLVDVEVRAQWRADRSGRSDARLSITTGTLAGVTIGNELCWDSTFERTFFTSDDPRQCAGGTCPEGDAAACAFPALFE